MDKQMTNKTLLEILVDELPGLGGWPEDKEFEFCAQDEKFGGDWNVIHFYTAKPVSPFSISFWSDGTHGSNGYKKRLTQLSIDWSAAIIMREQYEQALAEKNNPYIPPIPPAYPDLDFTATPVWNGEGLPPVGTVCEIKGGYDWLGVTIQFISDCHTIFITKGGTECCYQTCALQFRPIHTPEQIEAERRERVTKQMFDVWNKAPSICYQKSFDYVYDAILAGKIEGVKIDG